MVNGLEQVPVDKSTGIQVSSSYNNLRLRSFNSMISPRSGNYDRLEGGLGPSRMTKKFAWKKFAIVAGVLVALVYFFGPRANKPLPWKTATQQRPMDAPGKSILFISIFVLINRLEDPVPDDPYDQPTTPPAETHPSTEPAIIHPTSFETDPDPSKTTYCTTPHTLNLPLVQYALMVDAGSTGSRIHIYKFNHCGPSASYEYETFKMTQPGLSKFAADPQGAARSLDDLLDEAVRVVPSDLRHCTPVAVKATAGLRMLPGSQSGDILHAVENRIREKYPFVLSADGKGVVIMDGKEEGVYAWITANYLLGTIGAGHHEEKAKGTYAVLDLGGGSTQIVFEPDFTKLEQHLEDGEHKYELTFGGKTHTLYQHSYLGYGLMRARKHVHSLVHFMSSIRATPPSEKERKEGVVGNPCLAKGMRRVVEVVDEQTGVAKNVTMDGDDIGSFSACDRILQLVLAKDAYVHSNLS